MVALLALVAPITAAEWSKYSGPNAAFYHTSNPVPTGTEVRIKVAAVGKSAEPKVLEFYGNSGVISEHRRVWTSVVKDQVLTYKLTKNMKVGIEVSGQNFWRRATEITSKDGYQEMRFADGWILHVKLVGQDF